MPRTARFIPPALVALLLLPTFASFSQVPDGSESDSLRSGFESPPNAARPRVWWHWMNGNITKEGIERDLEWMKRVGIGGLQNFDGALDTSQVVDKRLVYMTQPWQDAFRYAAELSDRMGLEFGIASSPGWSETGGPWVEPKDGMKKLVWSATHLVGARHFLGRLAAPPSVAGPFQDLPMIDVTSHKGVNGPRFYRDVAVVAYRTPPALRQDSKPAEVTTSDPAVRGSAALHGGITSPITLTTSEGRPAWALYDYGKPRRFRAASLSCADQSSFAWLLEASDDGKTFRRVAEFPRDYSVTRTTISFPAITARFLRLSVQPQPLKFWADPGANAPGAEIPSRFSDLADHVTLNELRFYGGARVHRFEEKAAFSVASHYYALDGGPNAADEAVDPATVTDLTGRMRADGTLDWTPPVGDWTVLRLGYSLTGKTNHPASPEATGLEVDKLDQQAVKAYLDRYLGNFERTVGPELMGRRGIRAFVTDSIESSGQNWTPALIAEFEARRGYDPTRWLPALTGVIVGDTGRSDRFLWDFRQTLMELISEAHYGQIAESAHQRGLIYYSESLEGYPTKALGDDLDMRQHADIPMAAIWSSYRPTERDGIDNHIADMRGAASVAHVFGQNLVAAESFTSVYEPWAFSPALLRPIIDLAFALGVNRPVIHTSAHQPTERAPGMTLGPYGQHFSRHETWAEFAGSWMDYLSRNAYLLQQGRFVADVAWFYGEEGPLADLYTDGEPPDLPRGYGFDFVNANMLLNQLDARDGHLVALSGASYRLLYLGGSSSRMTLRVLRKLKILADAGVVIAGRRPTGSPSLGDEDHDAEYRQLLADLWDRGRVIESHDPDAVLATSKVDRDFDYTKPLPESHVMFLHRSLPGADIYFLTNRTPRAQHIEARFRVTSRKPEQWRADTGAHQALSWRIELGRTVVPLDLRANDSFFVVFREGTSKTAEEVPQVKEHPVLDIGGDWQLSFESGRGAPEGARGTRLFSWTESPQVGIKYFSGLGTYRKTFSVDPALLERPGRLILDLGEVHEVAEVTLNGRTVGTTWHAPFELDVTEAIKSGANTLSIRVANLWVNRLIGDKQPGAVPIAFTVTGTYKPDAPLRPSGLLGPVMLIARAPASP